jgi:adenylate cyclase
VQGSLRVTAHLLDRTTGEQVWGDSYDTAPTPGRWSGPLDDVARVIAARVGAEEGVIVQVLAGAQKKGLPTPATAYDALLLSYQFFLARDPAVLGGAIEALQRVVEADPGCAPAWTRLARLFLANHNFELTPIATPIEQAMTYAHRGVRLDASSRPARCMLASVLLTKGELDAARAELDEALRLSPDSLVYLEIIGYLLTLAGDWDRGQALSRSARERNPHCLPHVLFGVWADRLRRGEIEAAYQAALEYRDPTFFWRSVMIASCLAQLGRPTEAEVAQLLRSKPDFEARGRVLIGRYIKFPEVMSVIVDGLAKAGVSLA